MNRRMIAFVLGRILLAEALLMVFPVITGLIYGESATASFAIPIAVLTAVGGLLGIKRPKDTIIYARDGFFIVAAAWLLMSFAGALPFYFCGHFASIWDCFFEIVSGFTTTGASILSDPGSLPRCILFWRSFSNWVGGMGVLVFVLAVIPLADNTSLHLMRAEVPGPVVGKLVPRIRDTAKILYAIYIAMTLVLVLLLLLGGMPLFDAICHSFATAGTGGFSVRTAGILYYDSAYIEIVLGIFMLLFGVNFNLYYFILIGRTREALKNEEFHWYLAICAIATACIAVNIFSLYQNTEESIRHAFFQVSSIMTTTGFATADFVTWPQFSQHLLVLLMMIGGCAGSTSGGMKISRLVLMLKSSFQETRKLAHPRLTTVVQLDGKAVERSTMRDIRTYFVMYVMIICISTLLLSLDSMDFITNFSAELTCFNNVGPGLGLVGPMSNFSAYSPFSKVLLSLNMLLGRLEIFPLIVLFSPISWRRSA